MKKYLTSRWAKAAAVLVLILSAVGTVLCGFSIVFLSEHEAYKDATGTLARQQILRSVTWRYEDMLVRGYYEAVRDDLDTKSYFERYFARENSNFFFRLYAPDGTLLLENYQADDVLWQDTSTRTYDWDEVERQILPGEVFIDLSVEAPGAETDHIEWPVADDEPEQEILETAPGYAVYSDYGPYGYLDENGEVLYYYDMFGGVQDARTGQWGSWYLDSDGNTVVEIWRHKTELLRIEYGVNAALSASDAYAWQLYALNFLLPLLYWVVAGLVVFACLMLAALVFLWWSAGRRRGKEGIHTSWFDRLPLDVLIALEVLALCGVGALLWESWDDLARYRVVTLPVIGEILLTVFAAGLMIALFVSFAVRCKTKRVFRGTLVFWVLHGLWRGVAWFMRLLPLVWRTALICCALVFLEFCFRLMSESYFSFGVFLIWLAERAAVVILILWVAAQIQKLKRSAEVMAAGNLTARTDTRHMLPELRKFGQALNSIGDGMNAAVDARMRSERMKTELITNVSHDLKTPLTSIVNYVDLMGQLEDLQPEVAKEYLEVLRRQSGRLKKLTEDLIEASKASSGAMTVNLAPVNLLELLQQAVGEYDRRMEEKQLELVLQCPDECTLLADGRLLWRVLDNLLSNCCKYSLPGTRVYLNVTNGQTKAAIFLKNVSRQKLDMDPAMLTERFVRGDSSRSSEGSGLGLSIARSLTQLQRGTFDVSCDGDLFKIQLTMPLYLGE